MKITFDPAKNRTNIRKHSVDLADVEPVFYDPAALTREDRDHHEERFVTLGMDGFGRLLGWPTPTAARTKSGCFLPARQNRTNDVPTKKDRP